MCSVYSRACHVALWSHVLCVRDPWRAMWRQVQKFQLKAYTVVMSTTVAHDIEIAKTLLTSITDGGFNDATIATPNILLLVVVNSLGGAASVILKRVEQNGTVWNDGDSCAI